jgi:hypothetical protein
MAEPSQMAALKIPMARRITSTRKNYRLVARKPSGEADEDRTGGFRRNNGFSRAFARAPPGERLRDCRLQLAAQKKSGSGQKFFERQSTCAIYSPLGFRCSFRVGREVLLVARFEQRNSWPCYPSERLGEDVYDLVTIEPDSIRLFSFSGARNSHSAFHYFRKLTTGH